MEAQTRLTPENAVAGIDRLILTAWRRKLPVYLRHNHRAEAVDSCVRIPRAAGVKL